MKLTDLASDFTVTYSRTTGARDGCTSETISLSAKIANHKDARRVAGTLARLVHPKWDEETAAQLLAAGGMTYTK